MTNAGARKIFLMVCAVAAAVAGVLIVGSRDSQQIYAGKGVTTEAAAASAGAQVMSTEPKLRIEPK